MIKHVILEGPTGSGKSTIAKALQRYALEQCKETLLYKHNGPPSDTDRQPLVLEYCQQLLLEVPVVFDRLHLSQFVYPELLGRDGGLTWSQLALVNRMIDAIGATVVVVNPGAEVCVQRWNDRKAKEGSHYITDAKVIEQACARFGMMDSRYGVHEQLTFDVDLEEVVPGQPVSTATRGLFDRLLKGR